MANVYSEVPWPIGSPQRIFVSFVDEVMTCISKERLKYWLEDLEEEQIAKMLKGMSMRSKEIVIDSLDDEKAHKVINFMAYKEKIPANDVLGSILDGLDKLIENLEDSNAYWTRAGESMKM